MPFTLQQLSDVEDIKQLKHRYFRSIDTGNEADLTSVFTEDVTIDYRGGGYRAKLQGRQNMVDFIGSAFNSDIVAQHHGHCPEISFTGPTVPRAHGIWKIGSSIRSGRKTRSGPLSTAIATRGLRTAGENRT